MNGNAADYPAIGVVASLRMCSAKKLFGQVEQGLCLSFKIRPVCIHFTNLNPNQFRPQLCMARRGKVSVQLAVA